MSELPLLNAEQMASFAARGFLRLDAVVPDEINAQFLAEVGEAAEPTPGRRLMAAYGELLARAQIPEVPAGVPLTRAYPQGTAPAPVTAQAAHRSQKEEWATPWPAASARARAEQAAPQGPELGRGYCPARAEGRVRPEPPPQLPEPQHFAVIAHRLPQGAAQIGKRAAPGAHAAMAATPRQPRWRFTRDAA